MGEYPSTAVFRPCLPKQQKPHEMNKKTRYSALQENNHVEMSIVLLLADYFDFARLGLLVAWTLWICFPIYAPPVRALVHGPPLKALRNESARRCEPQPAPCNQLHVQWISRTYIHRYMSNIAKILRCTFHLRALSRLSHCPWITPNWGFDAKTSVFLLSIKNAVVSSKHGWIRSCSLGRFWKGSCTLTSTPVRVSLFKSEQLSHTIFQTFLLFQRLLLFTPWRGQDRTCTGCDTTLCCLKHTSI